MIKNLVDAIRIQAEHIKNVKTFKYEGFDLINTQHNNTTLQVWVEDDIYVEYLTTKDLVKVQLNIDILDNLNDDDKLTVHDRTSKVGIVLIKLIEENYKNIISVDDYNLLNVSNFSDDDLFGTRISLYIIMPSPINQCNIDEFIDMMNKYYVKEDKVIDIEQPQINVDELNITPIKLKRNE